MPLIPHRFDSSFEERGKIVATLPAVEWPFRRVLQTKLKKRAGPIVGDWKEERQKEFDKQDWWTYLRDLGFSSQELLRRDLMDSTDFGESIQHVGSILGSFGVLRGRE